jgi:large subunit ribosomal protein L29
MSEKEMDEKEAELRRELMRARTQISSKVPPDNPGQVREIRRTIARLSAERRERKIR